MKIGKPTWNWQYCTMSGWSFQVGEPHLERYCPKNPRLIAIMGKKRMRPSGEFTLHVFYAKWVIKKKGSRILSNRSGVQKINMTFARLNGIDLKSIHFHRDGWIKQAVFDESVILEVVPYKDSDSTDDIANWLVKND